MCKHLYYSAANLTIRGLLGLFYYIERVVIKMSDDVIIRILLQVLSCVYTSAEKSTEFKLIMLVRVPLYSQTGTH